MSLRLEIAPQFIMDGTPVSETEVRKPAEIILDHVKTIVGPYRRVLESDVEDHDLAKRELAELKKEELKNHLQELDILTSTLGEFLRSPRSFEAVVQNRKTLETRQGERQTFTVRFKPKGEKVPIGKENVQNQLSLHVSMQGSERAVDAIYALGLKGQEPQKVLERFFRESRDQEVYINTVGVYYDRTDERIRINPQAGVKFSYSRGEKFARGVVYVGTQPHVQEIKSEAMPRNLFLELQREIVRLSGFEKKNRS